MPPVRLLKSTQIQSTRILQRQPRCVYEGPRSINSSPNNFINRLHIELRPLVTRSGHRILSLLGGNDPSANHLFFPTVTQCARGAEHTAPRNSPRFAANSRTRHTHTIQHHTGHPSSRYNTGKTLPPGTMYCTSKTKKSLDRPPLGDMCHQAREGASGHRADMHRRMIACTTCCA